ncbi:MAG: hypothetical protein J6B01_11490 [Ruminococcus sp.]|nr:hypothetical protein [Ruminococcus sp.]
MDKNKLEKAVKGIKMPEETAEKIIAKCREYESSAADGEEYSEQVSGVEKAENRIVFRLSAAAAALAVAAGGLGMTAYLSRRPEKNTNHLDEVEVDSTDIQHFTNSIEITEEPTTIEISAEPDKYSETEKMYYSFIAENLIPEYGLASMDEFTQSESDEKYMDFVIPSQTLGVVSADISDYTGDGKEDMLAVIYDESEENYDWKIRLYSYDDTDVYMIDEYVASYGKFFLFNETYFSLQKVNERLVIHSSYITAGEESSYYMILGTSESGFIEETAEIVMNFDNPEQITLYTENDHIVTPDDCTNFHEYFYSEYKETTTTPEKINYQLIDFEALAQEGIPVRYTLSDKPMPDLTPEQCRLLDEFISAAADAFELIPAESRSSSSEPAMKFEAVRNGDISCYMYIYPDDYVYIMKEDGTSALYCYKGSDGYMNSPLRTRIETVFRNGNIADNAAFYPPFGNFSKMSSEPYKVTVFDCEGVIHVGEVSGEVLHHTFYGYNWTECEDVMTKTEPSDINIIRIEFLTIDGYETVSVDNSGYVTWYINSSDTVRNYQLNDTRPFDMIISNV